METFVVQLFPDSSAEALLCAMEESEGIKLELGSGPPRDLQSRRGNIHILRELQKSTRVAEPTEVGLLSACTLLLFLGSVRHKVGAQKIFIG